MKIDFNDNWSYRRLENDEEWKNITIPHDAMIFEKRTELSDGGTNTGWYEGHDYEYVKTFFAPQDMSTKDIIFEFEGVYHNAEVYINGAKAAYRPYGYTNFYVNANDFLKYGEDNQIRVIARNSDQPNSRWYSGAGIYRPVYMHVLDKKRILLNGVKITTLQLFPAVVEVTVNTNCPGYVNVEITDGGNIVAWQSLATNGQVAFSFNLKDAKLWTVENPFLYTCNVSFEGDNQQIAFGVRTIGVSARKGFTLNGQRVIIRGACIHHDNGILGARCYAEAEERKVKILKQYGYNAIRSAHNPCSKALLDACEAGHDGNG
jgi:beta-galactosidase